MSILFFWHYDLLIVEHLPILAEIQSELIPMFVSPENTGNCRKLRKYPLSGTGNARRLAVRHICQRGSVQCSRRPPLPGSTFHIFVLLCTRYWCVIVRSWDIMFDFRIVVFRFAKKQEQEKGAIILYNSVGSLQCKVQAFPLAKQFSCSIRSVFIP